MLIEEGGRERDRQTEMGRGTGQKEMQCSSLSSITIISHLADSAREQGKMRESDENREKDAITM